MKAAAVRRRRCISATLRGASITADDQARHFEPPQPQSGVCSKVMQGEGQSGVELLLRRADEQVKTARRDGPTCEERGAPALYDQFSLDPELERWTSPAAGMDERESATTSAVVDTRVWPGITPRRRRRRR